MRHLGVGRHGDDKSGRVRCLCGAKSAWPARARVVSAVCDGRDGATHALRRARVRCAHRRRAMVGSAVSSLRWATRTEQSRSASREDHASQSTMARERAMQSVMPHVRTCSNGLHSTVLLWAAAAHRGALPAQDLSVSFCSVNRWNWIASRSYPNRDGRSVTVGRIDSPLSPRPAKVSM